MFDRILDRAPEIILLLAVLLGLIAVGMALYGELAQADMIPGEYIIGDDNDFGQSSEGPVYMNYVGDTPDGYNIYRLQDTRSGAVCFIVNDSVSCIPGPAG